MTELRARLSGFDGRHTGPLEALAEEMPQTPTSIDLLLRAAADPEAEVAATWVLKRLVERGANLEPGAWSAVTALLFRAATVHGLLHVLQIMRPDQIEPRHRSRVADRLMQLASHERPFIRAWACGLLIALSTYLPARAGEIEAIIERAEMADSASVQARIRRARTELERGGARQAATGSRPQTHQGSRKSPPRRECRRAGHTPGR